MQKLREKMRENRKYQVPPVDVQPLEEPLEGESPMNDEIPISQEAYMPPNKLPPKNSDELMPKLEDVDFKYLSELIHRVNHSDSKNRLSPVPFDLHDDLKHLQKLQIQQSRRSDNPYNLEPLNIKPEINQHRNLHRQGSDDNYYTNLGRQIASMIRNADNSKLEHLGNKDPEQQGRQLQYHSVLNENSYSPRSFWERSVRSPLSHIGNLNNYLDETRTLKHSNEKKLLNLENEFEIFASSPSPLSLQDLENILNTMQKAQVHMKYIRGPFVSAKQSNASLNINLLPKYEKTDNNYRRLFNVPDFVEYIPPVTQKNYFEMQTMNASNPNAQNQDQNRNIDVPFNDYWMYTNVHPNPVSTTHRNRSHVRENQINNTNRTKNLIAAGAFPNNNSKKPRMEYLQFLQRNIPVIKQTKRPRPKFISSPPVLNYQSLNYFSGNKHHYMFEEASYPLRMRSYKRQNSKPFGKPSSYFHHELHHFDYFD